MGETRDESGAGAGHERPPGVGDTTVEAVGALTEALETVERARGHLYAFHQLTGHADLALDRTVELLRMAGHVRQADLVEREILGRDVVPGCWTYQIVEAYDTAYYQPFTEVEAAVRRDLVAGRRHLYEAEMKAARQTRGHPHDTGGS
ncbi:hypothetical protein OG909_31525 [Streptomyces sp. NBC_01754]|uniref:hypothetical protein n=1 Tax=Streptomyces sp. NBC_01754 TaxID=2975930 RepID=UPI002DDA5D1A|nr:hypothetical protein [Streptomyces sp. NBC_01754]WSC96476.1 hypothetical protein OG909_31525 [Streptomyces sp. NBC_01754]